MKETKNILLQNKLFLIFFVLINLSAFFFYSNILRTLVFADEITSYSESTYKQASENYNTPDFNLINSSLSQTDKFINVGEKISKKEASTDDVQRFLKTKNPEVFKNGELARIIIEESKKAGADPAIIIALMGKESAYCNANYKIYNCFGYLDGVQYESFEDAFRKLIPPIASMIADSDNNTRIFADYYRPVDRDGWAQRLNEYSTKIRNF